MVQRTELQPLPFGERIETRYQVVTPDMAEIHNVLYKHAFAPFRENPVSTFYLGFQTGNDHEGPDICFPNIRLRGYTRMPSPDDVLRLEVKEMGGKGRKWGVEQSMSDLLSLHTFDEVFPFIFEHIDRNAIRNMLLLQIASNRVHWMTDPSSQYPRVTVDSNLTYRLLDGQLHIINEILAPQSKLEIKTAAIQHSQEAAELKAALEKRNLASQASETYFLLQALQTGKGFLSKNLYMGIVDLGPASLSLIPTEAIIAMNKAKKEPVNKTELTTEFPGQEVQMKLSLQDNQDINELLRQVDTDLRSGALGQLTILPDWDVGENVDRTEQRFLNHVYAVDTPQGLQEAAVVVEADLKHILESTGNYRDLLKPGALPILLESNGITEYPKNGSVQDMVQYMIDNNIPLYIMKQKQSEKPLHSSQPDLALYVSDEMRLPLVGNEALQKAFSKVSATLGQELTYVGTYHRTKRKVRFTNSGSGRDYAIGADICFKQEDHVEAQKALIQFEIELKNRRGIHEVDEAAKQDALHEMSNIADLLCSVYGFKKEAVKKFSWVIDK